MKHFTLIALVALFCTTSASAQQPKGTLYDHLQASCVGYENYYLTYYYISSVVKGRIAQVVEAEEDGIVYIQNLMPTFPVNTWVKAERAGGDTLIVKAQEIYDYRNEKYTICRMKYTGDAAHQMPNYAEDKDNPDVTFTWKDGVLKTTSDLDNLYDRTVGVRNSKGTWYKYAASQIVLEPVTAQPTLLPEGATVEQFMVRHKLHQRIIIEDQLANTQEYDTIQVAFQGNDVYVKPYGDPVLPGWIKGTIDGDKVVFDSPQYLGANDSIIGHYYFVAGTERHFTDDIYKEYYNGYFPDFDTAPQCVMQFDPATKTMTTDQAFAVYNSTTSVSEQYGNLYNYAVWEAHNYIKVFYESKMFKYEEKPGTPRTPEFISYDDYMERENYENIRLCFYIYPETTEGDYLDINRVYYVMYVDDDEAPYDFDASDYLLIDGDFTYVPFTLSDRYDILNYGVRHVHYIYFTGFDRIGLQAIFESTDGTEYPSHIRWYDVESGESYDAVKDLRVPTLRSSDSFDLAGRRVNGTAKGLVIKSITTADGKHRFVKMLNK